jgi:hypothetical protein
VNETTSTIDAALRLFVIGAQIQHFGYYLDDPKMQVRGLELTARAIGLIDGTSSVGRDALLPLLSHKAPAVQVTAAGALWQSHTDLALPLLRKIELTAMIDAGDTAMWLLFSNGQINACGSDPRHPSLYSEEANARPWGSTIVQ